MVYINKITGGFVIPELAIYGDWKQLQDLLVVYAKNRSSSKGTGQVASDLPTIALADMESMVADTWRAAQPVESLSGQEFKKIIKQFGLSRELRPEDFAYHQVRYSHGKNTQHS